MAKTNALSTAPALSLLVPLALGIYLRQTDHSPGLIVLGCGLCFCLVWLLSRRSIESYQWRSIALHLGLMLAALALGMLRAGTALETGPSEEVASLRLELVAGLAQQGISTEVQQLIQGLSLGYLPRGEAVQALRESFARSGAAHLLVVSGYHLGLVVALMARLLGQWREPYPRLYYALLLLGSWAFVALTGWGLPSVRAALMLSIYLIANILGRSAHTPNILALSAIIQLVYDPQSLYNWGMWLSYTAVLSIYLYYALLRDSLGWIRNPLVLSLWEALCLTLAAQVLTLPLVMYLFGYVSLSFVFTALPLGLLASILIPLSLLAYLMAYCALPLGPLAIAIEYLGQWMLELSAGAGALTGLVHAGTMPWWGLLLSWGLAALLSYALRPALWPSDSGLYRQWQGLGTGRSTRG